jgi:hypothetical protein
MTIDELIKHLNDIKSHAEKDAPIYFRLLSQQIYLKEADLLRNSETNEQVVIIDFRFSPAAEKMIEQLKGAFPRGELESLLNSLNSTDKNLH